VWLYFRFPLSLCHVEHLLVERGIGVSFQTVLEWALKFGLEFARSLRPRSKGSFADKWHFDEMAVPNKGKKYWLWRAVNADGCVLDTLLQSRRNRKAALKLMRKLPKGQGILAASRGDRQASIRWYDKAGHHAWCRASSAQRLQQSSGEFASGCTTTGAGYDPVQVSNAPPTVRSPIYFTFPATTFHPTIIATCEGLPCRYGARSPICRSVDHGPHTVP
jgi:hypothetical protein